VWWSADFFTAMRATAGADRSVSTSSLNSRRAVVNLDVRCEKSSTGLHEEAKALGLEDKIGSIESASR